MFLWSSYIEMCKRKCNKMSCRVTQVSVNWLVLYVSQGKPLTVWEFQRSIFFYTAVKYGSLLHLSSRLLEESVSRMAFWKLLSDYKLNSWSSCLFLEAKNKATWWDHKDFEATLESRQNKNISNEKGLKIKSRLNKNI